MCNQQQTMSIRAFSTASAQPLIVATYSDLSFSILKPEISLRTNRRRDPVSVNVLQLVEAVVQSHRTLSNFRQSLRHLFFFHAFVRMVSS